MSRTRRSLLLPRILRFHNSQAFVPIFLNFILARLQTALPANPYGPLRWLCFQNKYPTERSSVSPVPRTRPTAAPAAPDGG